MTNLTRDDIYDIVFDALPETIDTDTPYCTQAENFSNKVTDALIEAGVIPQWRPISERPHNAGEQFLTTDGEMIIPSESVGIEGIYHHNITCHTSIKNYAPTHWMLLPIPPKE